MRSESRKLPRPQYVVPGQVILADRVSLEQRFMLRPDRPMRILFYALLAYYAAVHGLKVHAVVLMSTHYHLLFTDTRGCRGDFFRDFHSMLAKAVQAHRGTKSPLFDKDPTSQVDNVTELAAVEAMAYVIANPTLAGIVADPTKWPGLFTRVEDAGRRRVERFEMPKRIRREDRSVVPFLDEVRWPNFVELVQEPLCDAVGMEPEACVEAVREELARLFEEKRVEQVMTGRRFVGVMHALHQRVTKQAASWFLPRRFRDDQKIRPRVKAGRGQRKARMKAVLRNFRFWEAHLDCVERIRRGELGVVFPAGTFRWHRLFGFPRVEATAAFYEMTGAFG